jgi:hypothetical protein
MASVSGGRIELLMLRWLIRILTCVSLVYEFHLYLYTCLQAWNVDESLTDTCCPNYGVEHI